MIKLANPKKISFNKAAALVLALLVGFACVLVIKQGVYAYSGGSTIQATICDNQPPALNIASPVNGQIIGTPSINLSGTTQRTTQIAIYINGNFSQNVAVGTDQLFDTQISLVKGVNNIKLDSYFSCNHTNASDQLSVTYKPPPTPTNGGSSGSGSNPSGSGGDISAFSKPTIYASGDSQISKTPEKTQRVSNPFERAKNNLVFGNNKNQNKDQTTDQKQADIKDSIVKPLASWLSLVIATLALMFAFMPAISTVWFKRLFKIDKPISLPQKISINILRLIALIIAIILLFFVQV